MGAPVRGSFGFRIVADDRVFAAIVGMAMRLETIRLRIGRGESLGLRATKRDQADVLIYAFNAAAMDDPRFAEAHVPEINKDNAEIKIFLQHRGLASADADRKNRLIESMARQCGAHLVTTADLMRSGTSKRLTKSGKPNLVGYLSIAHVALRAIKTHILRDTLRTNQRTAPSEQRPPDADRALKELKWDEPFLPATLEGNYGREAIEDFVNGWVIFPSFRSWGRFKLGDPIDWGMEGANWSWQSYFTGLEFVRPALAYWYAAANGQTPARDDVGEFLKSRGLDANALLMRASSIIADFVRANPPTKPANQRAFFQGTICRRVKALLTFLVCCGKAQRLGIAINRDEFALALQGLSDSLEILKSDEVYPKAGNHGVRQDALFIAAGLLMPHNEYAQGLLHLGIERLQRFQLDRVLLPDGVWQENSYGYHCLIMNVFQMLAGDLRRAGLGEAGVLHDALRRMLPYAEGLIRPDGYGPLIGDTTPRRHFGIMAKSVDELNEAGDSSIKEIELKTFVRAKDTYYFPNGGYLASHTARALDSTGSTMIFFTTLSGKPKHKQSDDLSVIFARGNTDLLIDGGTYNKEISDTVRNSARYDPASHSTFRVNGAGYPLRMAKGARRAGLTGQWQGDGWAAARGFNEAYEDARVDRVAIHLKHHHAVIVLDELTSKSRRPARFDQFWHIAPDFTPKEEGPRNWTCTSSGSGTLLAAFDSGEANCTAGFGGPDDPIAWTMLMDDDRIVPTPYLQRTKELQTGRMASLFQWTEHVGAAEIDFATSGTGATEIQARGDGFACTLRIAADKVELLSSL
jgi:hypothetical protein